MATRRIGIAVALLSVTACVRGADRAGPSSSARSGETGVAWSQSYEVGMRVAEREDSPLLLLFTASWCSWCHKLEQEVLTAPQVMAALRQFVCVKIDVDQQREIALAYGVASLPRVVVVNTHGEMIGDWLGYRAEEDVLQLIQDIQPYTHAAAGVRKAPTISRTAAQASRITEPAQIVSGDPSPFIDLLGHRLPEIRRNVIDVLVKGGTAVLPALVDALEHEYLGVRITAWKIVRLLGLTDTEFDPWAPRVERAEAVKKLTEKIQNVSPATESDGPPQNVTPD